jgi:PEP-CTERM motif-containing protein
MTKITVVAAFAVLCCAGIADAEVVGPFEVTSGFFDTVLTSTWDGVFLIAGDRFSIGGNGQNNFDPLQLPLGHSSGGTGTATAPLTFDGRTFPSGILNMRFTHDPITIWPTGPLNSPQSSPFTMIGAIDACFPFLCPALNELPVFGIVGQGTMTAEWRITNPLLPQPFFFVSFDFTAPAQVPEPSTAAIVVLGSVLAALAVKRGRAGSRR